MIYLELNTQMIFVINITWYQVSENIDTQILAVIKMKNIHFKF